MFGIGTCSIGEKQSPINIALAEHFAQSTQETNNGQKQKIGDMKIHFEQKQDGIGDLGFDFQHELNDAENFKFDIEQNVEDFGNIKFHFELKFQQKPNRFGDISFQYNNQVGAVVKNTGHGTMQVSNCLISFLIFRCSSVQRMYHNICSQQTTSDSDRHHSD